MSQTFNTGNNPPTQRGVLKDIAQIAYNFYSCQEEGPIGDAGGRYAFRMTTPEGMPFILVAKGSRLWIPEDIGEAVVSVQRQLLVTASMLDRPIILGYRPDPRSRMFISWYRFFPEVALTEGFETNMRSPKTGLPQTRMWNFPLRLGEELDGPQDAWKVPKKTLILETPMEVPVVIPLHDPDGSSLDQWIRQMFGAARDLHAGFNVNHG